MMRDPVTVQGLGDGGAHSAIICDASMTTYLLTHWARDRSRGPRLPLELVVDAAHVGGCRPLRARTIAVGCNRACGPTSTSSTWTR